MRNDDYGGQFFGVLGGYKKGFWSKSSEFSTHVKLRIGREVMSDCLKWELFLGLLLVSSCNTGGTSGSGVGSVRPERPSSSILYSASNSEFGRELWFYNADLKASTRLTDINPGSGASNPEELTIGGGKYYFVANDGTRGKEVWVFNPADQTSSILRDVRPGAEGSDPKDLHFLDGKLYFSADDSGLGRDLFFFNLGNSTLTKVNLNSSAAADPKGIELYESKFYMSAVTENNGRELVVYTPNLASYKIFNFRNDDSARTSSNPSEIIFSGGYAYFSVTFDDIGREVGKVNTATLSVPEIAADINPGPGDSNPVELTILGSKIYLRASHPTTGKEIYFFDTESGNTEASLAGEFFAGPSDGEVSHLLEFGGSIYFTSEESSTYGNLYSLKEGQGPIQLETELLSEGQTTQASSLVPGNKTLLFVHDSDQTGAGGSFSGEIMSYTPGADSLLGVFDTDYGVSRSEAKILKLL